MATGPLRQRPREEQHSERVAAAYDRMLDGTAVTRRWITLDSGLRVHLLEAGDGPPVLHLHGSTTSSLSHLSLLERSGGVRSTGVDRPGFGLSQPMRFSRRLFREMAVDFVEAVMDALHWPSATLAGGSMGGTWALWFALAHPDRVRSLVLLGSAPLLPGTRAPLPLRVMTVPLVGDLLARGLTPDAAQVVRIMGSMGEAETIAAHPDLVESLVAAAADPVAAAANLAELRAALSFFGFRRRLRITDDEMRRLAVPALLVWGDGDPVGSVAVAQAAEGVIPHARLEVLAAGHVPWLGHPDLVARLLAEQARSV